MTAISSQPSGVKSTSKGNHPEVNWSLNEVLPVLQESFGT